MEGTPTWNSVYLEDISSISKQVMKHSNIVKVCVEGNFCLD